MTQVLRGEPSAKPGNFRSRGTVLNPDLSLTAELTLTAVLSPGERENRSPPVALSRDRPWNPNGVASDPTVVTPHALA